MAVLCNSDGRCGSSRRLLFTPSHGSGVQVSLKTTSACASQGGEFVEQEIPESATTSPSGVVFNVGKNAEIVIRLERPPTTTCCHCCCPLGKPQEFCKYCVSPSLPVSQCQCPSCRSSGKPLVAWTQEEGIPGIASAAMPQEDIDIYRRSHARAVQRLQTTRRIYHGVPQRCMTSYTSPHRTHTERFSQRPCYSDELGNPVYLVEMNLDPTTPRWLGWKTRNKGYPQHMRKNQWVGNYHHQCHCSKCCRLGV